MSFDAFWELKARSLPVEEPEALARAVWEHCHSVLTPKTDDQARQIAELTRERDEARAELRCAYEIQQDYEQRLKGIMQALSLRTTEGDALIGGIDTLKAENERLEVILKDMKEALAVQNSAREDLLGTIRYVSKALGGVDCGAAPVEELARRAVKAITERDALKRQLETARVALEHVRECLAVEDACCCLRGDKLIQAALAQPEPTK